MNDSQYPAQREYLRSASELKRSIAINTADYRFSQRKDARVVYIFDTNICETYLTPGRQLLPPDASYRGLFKGSASNIMERLASRFLFEGQLPGQHGDSVYLSPPHWNETLRRITSIERSLSSYAQQFSIDHVEERLQSLKAYRDRPRELLTAAEDQGFAEILKSLASASSLDKRLQTLWGSRQEERPRVRSLEYSDVWNEAVDHVNRQDYRFWQLKLNEARAERKEKHKSKKRNSKTKSHMNVDNDAMTLAAIQALYREHEKATGPNPKLRFIFVTGDMTLLRVVEKNHERLDLEGIHHFVRSPSTYMPFINYEYLHEQLFDGHGDFEETEDLVRDIGGAVRAVLALQKEENPLSTFSQSVIDFRENIDRWSHLANLIAIVGASYFKEDFDDDEHDAREIADLFQNEWVISAAVDRLNGRISDIRADHTQQIAMVAIERLSKRIPDNPDDKVARLRRSPLRLLDTSILAPLRLTGDPDFQGISDLEEFLDSLANTSKSDNQITIAQTAIVKLKDAWKDKSLLTQTYLLAASIYFSVGAWESARVCADICIRQLREKDQFKGQDLREAQYCKALALRMNLRSERDYEDARSLLTENMADGERNNLAFERDKIERSALILTAAIVQSIEQRKPRDEEDDDIDAEFLEDEEIAAEFKRGITQTREAIQTIEDNFMVESNLKIASLIALQGATNLVGAAIFNYFLNIASVRTMPIDITNEAKALRQLLRNTDSAPTFTAQLYLKCADLISSPSRSGFAELESFMEKIRSSYVDLTWTDSEEQEFLMEEMGRLSRIF